MTKENEITVFRTAYVERVKEIEGNKFRVTRCVNLTHPLPGDILSEQEYEDIVKNKYIRVICDPDGKVSKKND